ncbi:MAG: NAD(P)-binding protein [Candidatus Thermoplasmatota archaeon]|nr:NAD(P)-binding protein [Candidatus Thermoplasmatota archaeon]MCL5791252.1 NAD(P)-binding protein [Candidatus Thermoplasmatota archaeon]
MKAFEEFEIAGCRLKNRFVMAPMISNLADADGSTNEVHTAYLNERAMGGFSLIITEYSFVPSRASRGSVNQLSFARHDQVGRFRRLSERVHSSDSRIFAQLVHAGGKAIPGTDGVVLAPSSVPYNGRIPEELNEEAMEEIRDAFVRSAKIVEMSNFDGIELHGAHGYLLQEFMSPSLNRRDDRYGGSLENMLRFPQEIIDAIREETSIPVGIRLSLYEDDPDGYPPEHGMKIAENLRNIDYVHFSSGRNAPPGSSASYYSSHNHIISRIKGKLKIPVIGVGSVMTAQDVEDALKVVDLVALGRAALSDPYFPKNLMAGRSPRPCIRCNQACRDLSSGQVRCTVNPFTGNELSFPGVWVDGEVTIAGGGVSGMEAAIYLAERGFRVTLYEGSERLGGQLNEITDPDKQPDFSRLLDYYTERIRELGINVILGKTVEKQDVDLFMVPSRTYRDVDEDNEIFIDSNIYKHLDQAMKLARVSRIYMTERSLDSLDRHRKMEYRRRAMENGIVFVASPDERFIMNSYEKRQYDIFQASSRGIWEAKAFIEYRMRG